MLVEKDAVENKWVKYFEGLLNVGENRETEIVAV